MRSSRLRYGAALAGLLLAGACGAEEPGGTALDSSEFGPEEAAVEADRLYQIINANKDIEYELQVLEQRVARKCMEDQGFLVHAPELVEEPFKTEAWRDYLSGAPDGAVPTVEDAKRWGFGEWTSAIWSQGNEDLVEELVTPEAAAEFDMRTEPYVEPTYEWDSQDTEYQLAWIEAYSGAPALNGEYKGPEIDSSAELGGCRLEMIETMYGEPVRHEAEEEGETDSWSSHPSSPAMALELDPGGDAAAWRDALDGEDTAFLDCITDRGYEDWNFVDDALTMPLWEYFGRMYEPDSQNWEGEGDGVEAPEPPEDAPTDFRGVFELEVAMATDFAECGEESGLRAAIEYGWALTLIDAYQEIEPEIVGWQEAMQEHLDKGQDYLGG